MLIRWFNAVTWTHNIALAIASETRAAKAGTDPLASSIFEAIDCDGDDVIQTHELVVYMLAQYPKAVAHRLLRALDLDGNGLITREEWQQGWSNGMISDLLRAHQEKHQDREVAAVDEEDCELGKNGLQVSAAARSVDPYGIMALTEAVAAQVTGSTLLEPLSQPQRSKAPKGKGGKGTRRQRQPPQRNAPQSTLA
uniref:EF-hand domain-containing protein n=1 Tax=Haptolina brevifila TaxID=156173 RepID=A0A7S2JLR5_9EUKA